MNFRIITVKVLVLLFIALNNLVLAKNAKEKENQIPIITRSDSAKSIKTLENDIEHILNHKHLHKTKVGLAVYSLDNNKYLYKKNIDKMFTPASNTKIVTVFTALSVLGKDFKINTDIYTDGKLLNDSTLKGNLYIVGRGDALFTEEDLEKLVLQLLDKGIKAVQGNIYADGSFFDDKTDRKVYSGDRDRVENLPPITGLSIENNTATVVVSAGSKKGAPLNVRIIPDSEAFETSCTAKVSAILNEENIINYEGIIPQDEIQIQKYGDADPDPARRRKSGVRIKTSVLENGRQKFSVSGRLNRNKIYSYRYYIKDPLTAVAGALKRRMELLGIVVKGSYGNKILPENDSVRTKMLATFSRPLSDLLEPINKNSNNYYAENLYKILGAYSGYTRDNALGAREIEEKNMMNMGIPCPDCALYDGSGLSRRNKISASALMNMLIISSGMNFSEILENTLSIAGIDGTLEKRMRATVSEANLRGKTGTLRNVSALSGYVNTLDNEKLAFVMLFNGPNVGSYKDIEDQLGILLSQFFYFNEEY